MANPSTAVLLFSRLPQAEVGFKQISSDSKKDAAIFSYLFNRTLRSIAHSNLPLLLFTEKEQTGNSFAEKITNAISMAFDKGFEQLIILGSDCPQLNSEHIRDAYHQLSTGNEIVAGQNRRGGLFLLGLQQKAFNKKRFLEFSWQTSCLFKDLSAYGAGYRFSHVMAVLQDINNPRDAQSTSCHLSAPKSWKQLLSLLFPTLHAFLQSLHYQVQQIPVRRRRSLRAPPVHFS